MKSKKMIIIVFGLPGTGKSFFARRLATAVDAAYYNTDLVREQMQKKGKYSVDDKEKVYDALAHLVKESIKTHQYVIADGTFSKNKYRQPLNKVAKEQNTDLCWIRTQADDATIRARVSKQREHSEADYAVYQKVKAEFEKADFPHLQLDSGKLTVEEMLQRATYYIFSDDRLRDTTTDG